MGIFAFMPTANSLTIDIKTVVADFLSYNPPNIFSGLSVFHCLSQGQLY